MMKKIGTLISIIVLFIGFYPLISGIKSQNLYQGNNDTATLTGTLTDHYTGYGLFGIRVSAGDFYTWSKGNGHFKLSVPEGMYDVLFTSYGYKDISLDSLVLVGGQVFTIDTEFMVKPVPPLKVKCTVHPPGIVVVSWDAPGSIVTGEIQIDDGSCEDMFVWALPGSQNAVRFGPYYNYPATLIGGDIYVGDGTFPGPFLGSSFDVAVYDDDGTGGLPGTNLGQMSVTVQNYGWVHFDSLNVPVYNGQVYLSMIQTSPGLSSAPIGIDYNAPTYNWGYSKFQNNDWMLSAYQDFMMRPWVAGHHDSVHQVMFEVGKLTDFDPQGDPWSGTLTVLAHTGSNTYTDFLPQTDYCAYVVKTEYSNGEWSPYTLSDVIFNIKYVGVEIHATLSTGLMPRYIYITLEGEEYYEGYTLSEGILSLNEVRTGTYTLRASRNGYEDYVSENVFIQNDSVFTIELAEKKYPPKSLDVDPFTGKASWLEPEIIAINQDFETSPFPPVGWEDSTNGIGWKVTSAGSGGGWTVPEWDSKYACVNDKTAGAGNDGCCDMLILPKLELLDQEVYFMTFDSYFDSQDGQQAYIKYSYDEGLIWYDLDTIEPYPGWHQVTIDLYLLCGSGGPPYFTLAFHADDNGNIASGWAIDNVKIFAVEFLSTYSEFRVYLDSIFISGTEDTNWLYTGLEDGKEYIAGVAAIYSSGPSDTITKTFTYHYLPPPQQLIGSVPEDFAILIWRPPEVDQEYKSSSDSIPVNLLGYTVYRNGKKIGVNLDPLDTVYYDMDITPCQAWTYFVTGIYDAEPYGYPGETRESQKEGPAVFPGAYFAELDFYEGWDQTIDDQCWINEDSLWVINYSNGNPYPSIKFPGKEINGPYSSVLYSPIFNEVNSGLGKIILDFDARLNCINPSGTEKLSVKVWNNIDTLWREVRVLSNEFGGTGWYHFEEDLTGYFGDVFMLCFSAEGSDPGDIEAWFLDNIRLRRICNPPSQTTSQVVEENNIMITWDYPDDTASLKGFTLFRRHNDGELTELDYTIDTFYIESGLLNGKYCYSIAAYYENFLGSCTSGLSVETCEVLTSGITTFPDKSAVFAYPNPFHDRIELSHPGFHLIQVVRIIISDITGEEVFVRDIFPHDGKISLDLQVLQRGVYTIRIGSEKATGILKVIKL